jgi:carbonic anhydrase
MRVRSLPIVLVLGLLLAGCRHRQAYEPVAYVPVAPAATPVAAKPVASAPALDAEDPHALLDGLVAGNQRYASGRALHPRQDAARRADVAQKQHPKVAVLACADSRTSPEVLFDQGLGDLFVVRVAGNVVSDEITASLEYCVEHLGVRLIVVLGHERCGAVKAALAGGEAPGHLASLLGRIQPAVAATPEGPDRESHVVAANARLTARLLTDSEPILKGAVAHHHLAVEPAVYDLDTGVVTFLRTP